MDEQNFRQMDFLRKRLVDHIEKNNSFEHSEISKLESAFRSYTVIGETDEIISLRDHLDNCCDVFEDLSGFGCVHNEDGDLVPMTKEDYYFMLKNVLKHIDAVIPQNEWELEISEIPKT